RQEIPTGVLEVCTEGQAVPHGEVNVRRDNRDGRHGRRGGGYLHSMDVAEATARRRDRGEALQPACDARRIAETRHGGRVGWAAGPCDRRIWHWIAVRVSHGGEQRDRPAHTDGGRTRDAHVRPPA